MPRRKKKYMLLRGKFGSFIVVERKWYDFTGINRKRMWKIVRESDDHEMLQAMASLSERHVPMRVNIETEN
jgi:hypothetical protein